MPQGCLEIGAKPYLTLLNFFFNLHFFLPHQDVCPG